MQTARSRREFLSEVGRGMLVATVGLEVSDQLGLASLRSLRADEGPGELSFGDLEPLVRLMQETPVNSLVSTLTDEWRKGTTLKRLTAAAALANARTFGGEDYVGFHTMMALAPALHMAMELQGDLQPLPIFKVLYRNTNRIQERGGRKNEVLHPVPQAASSEFAPSGERLREAVRNRDLAGAEQMLATAAGLSSEDAFNQVLYAVQDSPEVHRVVMPYRAWDLLGLIGKEQANTLLRQ